MTPITPASTSALAAYSARLWRWCRRNAEMANAMTISICPSVRTLAALVRVTATAQPADTHEFRAVGHDQLCPVDQRLDAEHHREGEERPVPDRVVAERVRGGAD